VELDAERCKLFGRFLRLRELAGDLVELDGPPASPRAQSAASPGSNASAAASSPVQAPTVPAAPKE
jgi:hypothetical protein